MKRIQGIAGLIDTLMLTLPSMANVASLVFLAIFIFTALGMSFYGDIDTKQEYVNGMYNGTFRVRSQVTDSEAHRHRRHRHHKPNPLVT